MLQFYGYKKCSTCTKAERLLTSQSVSLNYNDITLNPPSATLLKKALENGYSLKDLFNKSGELYRSMDMKNKLPQLSQAEALQLLAANGKLIKRPFVFDGLSTVVVGYDELRLGKLK